MAGPTPSPSAPTPRGEHACAIRKRGAAVAAPLLFTLLLFVASCDGAPSPTSSTVSTAAEDVEGTDDTSSGDPDTSGSTSDSTGTPDDPTESDPSPFPHQPSGFSLFAETSYAAAEEGGFSSSLNSNFAIVDDGSAPRSASKVARATFPAGLGDGKSPIWSAVSISNRSARRLYLSFWVKISRNWQGHQSGVNKVVIAWTHQSPVVVANILGSGSSRLSSQVRIQDVPDGAQNLSANIRNPEIVRAQWHRWEMVLVTNSGGAADGQIHWWIDGKKAGEYRNIRFGTAGQSKIWNNAAWRPVWGGRGDVILQTQYMWMDHYYVSGAG